ncbi:MAG: hypothetical protein SF187_05655 [Deltaproteobacteria bacterium]|nr:hypothetical protein [Deltaproteobacteria bacterium]
MGDFNEGGSAGGAGGTTSVGGSGAGGVGGAPLGEGTGGLAGQAGAAAMVGGKGGASGGMAAGGSAGTSIGGAAGAPLGSAGAGGSSTAPADLADARAHPFLEAGGKVLIEAEHGVPVARGDFPWVLKTDHTGFSGAGYMVAHAPMIAKDDPRRVGDAPDKQSMLVFFVSFETIGTYRLWAWRHFPDNGADSYFWQLDNQPAKSAIDSHAFGKWQWSNTYAGYGSFGQFKIEAPGVHEIRIIRRETNAAIDRLLITTDAAKLNEMSGPGGAESPRAK